MTVKVSGVREQARTRRLLVERIGRQVAAFRSDLGVTRAALARCAGIDPGHVSRIEAGKATPSLDALLRMATCLGADVSVRLFPVAGPRLHDRFQAPMIEALFGQLGPLWRPRPEVPVPTAHGVIDAVLSRPRDALTIVCECHSELRRLDLALRRLAEKAEAMRGLLESSEIVSTLLVLRSTAATRATARAYHSTLAAAFPANASQAVEALRGGASWPGPAIVWVRLDGGRAVLLDEPPRGVRVGR